MITMEQIPSVLGHTVYDSANKKIGTAEHVFLDQETGQPTWMTVRTGLFGNKETFVPLAPAELRGDDLIVPFAKDQIKNAPNIEADVNEGLAPAEEAFVYEYYGLAYGGEASGSAGQAGTDDAMTRSEERLRVGRETRESGRVRLTKYVTVEEEQQTVPVRREHVRVEREPITDENRDRAMAGSEISEAEHEVVLHEERPVMATETVPVERVRLEKETVTQEETVRGKVRKEHIKTEGDVEDR